jgi:hypothetical protein
MSLGGVVFPVYNVVIVTKQTNTQENKKMGHMMIGLGQDSEVRTATDDSYDIDAIVKGVRLNKFAASSVKNREARGEKDDFVEWISTPMKPEVYILREEDEPYSSTKKVYRAYRLDGTPLYIGRKTKEDAEEALRASRKVKNIIWE